MRMWFKRVLIVLTVAAGAALFEPPAVAQAQTCECCNSDATCRSCTAGAMDCAFYEGPIDNEKYCAPKDGPCGMFAVTMSGELIVPAAVEVAADNASFDPATGEYRRMCDGALIRIATSHRTLGSDATKHEEQVLAYVEI